MVRGGAGRFAAKTIIHIVRAYDQGYSREKKKIFIGNKKLLCYQESEPAGKQQYRQQIFMICSVAMQ
jgi:hypothetical protein